MERTWLILGRVIRVVQAEAQAQVQHAAVGEAEDASQAQAEQAAVGEAEDAAQAQAEQAAVGEAEDAAAQAEQAAVGEAEVAAAREELEDRVMSVEEVPANLGAPGFTISVAPPPRVTFLTARDKSQPNGDLRDIYPYIIATGPFCLLAHFATGRYPGTDFRCLLTGRRERDNHHLILVRYFRRAGGQIAATAVRVPARPWVGVTDLRSIESISLVCDGYNYRIAELMVDTGRRNPSLELVIFRSDQRRWFAVQSKSPLVDWDRYRMWVPHGAVAVDSTVMWFDLSWGILSCDVEQEEPGDFEVFFYRLPRGRALRKGGATEDIHRRRCIAVSGDLLRYVEIIIPDPNGEAAAVSMWSLQMGEEGQRMRWIANYRVSFPEIWNNDSYAATGLAHDIPVLAGVCPANPNVVYFDLQQRLFGVNVPERRVVEYEANQHELVNMPGVPQMQTGSSRYLVTWNLLRPGTGEIIGHVSPDLHEDDFPADKDEEPKDQDPKGKSKATDGRRKSTSASSRPSKSLRIE